MRTLELSDIHTIISKRLCYILKYSARTEGLHPSDDGWVDIGGLVVHPLFRKYSVDNLLSCVRTSRSSQGSLRFEERTVRNGQVEIRAAHGRQLTRPVNHTNSRIPRLLEMCLEAICRKIDDYDLSDFPDPFLVNELLRRLKFRNRLSRRALESLLGVGVDQLDLSRVYVTEPVLQLVRGRCPKLRYLSLVDCDYAVGDAQLLKLVKSLPELLYLNVGGCERLTDKSLEHMLAHVPNIRVVKLERVIKLSFSALQQFIQGASALQLINICGIPSLVYPDIRNSLYSAAAKRNVKLILGDDDKRQ